MISYGSVCSGIESASVAWEPLGFTPSWFSEIEPFPCAVLAHRFPNVANLGDMSLLPDAVRCGAIPAPDVLVGGTPCQAFSIAGKQESLADARGGLSLIYGDLLNALDEKRGAGNEAVCLWENVPGVLSTKDNAFGYLLGLLAGGYTLADCLSGAAQPIEAQPGASRQKWPKSGCVIGPVRTVAWRVLDAQYFGLAQRRKRVFVVASARDGFDPAEVLFEREGVRRDTAPSSETGQAVTGSVRESVVGSLCARTCQAIGVQEAMSGHILPAQNALSTVHHHAVCVGHRQVAFGEYTTDETASTMKARDYKDAKDLVVSNGQAVVGGYDPVVYCGTQNDAMRDCSLNVAPTLRAGNGGGSVNQVVSTPSVRRLIPVECERLQGFPDNWTAIPWRNKPDAPDGHRYKAIGNSKAVPVVQWLGARIAMELFK